MTTATATLVFDDLEQIVEYLVKENIISKGKEALGVYLDIQNQLAFERPDQLVDRSYGTVRYGFVPNWDGYINLLIGGTTYGTQRRSFRLEGFRTTGSAEYLNSQGGIRLAEISAKEVSGVHYVHIRDKRLDFFNRF